MAAEVNMQGKVLAPSVLSADFANLDRDIQAAGKAGAQWVHCDVMDGRFVPNISFGIPVLKAIRSVTDCPLDVHLMIEEPERYLEAFKAAGADIISVHGEAVRHLDRTVEHIKELGLKCAVALNPATPVLTLKHILPKLNMVLIMSVNPGFGGQKFIPYTLDKIKELSDIRKKQGLSFLIEVDGGVTLENADQLLSAGADILVAGSAVFGGDISNNVKAFLNKMNG